MIKLLNVLIACLKGMFAANAACRRLGLTEPVEGTSKLFRVRRLQRLRCSKRCTR